ncbi:Protein with carboxyl methyl esterase activity, partial [Dissophora globulifera]
MTTATSAPDSAVPTAQVPELAHLSPLPWTDFFETKRQVSIPYELDASEITHTLYEIGSDRKDLSKVIVLHHGAAHCALSFAATARELKKLVGSHARIMSLDARGHGED